MLDICAVTPAPVADRLTVIAPPLSIVIAVVPIFPPAKVVVSPNIGNAGTAPLVTVVFAVGIESPWIKLSDTDHASPEFVTA